MSARVLLVGPSDRQFEELKVALEQEGFLTETASDGAQALETGCRFQPDLVITETVLNGISGFELSSHIFNGEAGFSAQVVIYTQSYRDEKLRQTAIKEHHVLHYFVKPFQKEALLNTVVPYLHGHELKQTQFQGPLRKPRTDSAAKPLTAKSAGGVPGGSGAARPGRAVSIRERPQPVKGSGKPDSRARKSDLLQTAHLSEDQFLSVTKSGPKKEPLGLLESSPESQPTDPRPGQAETTVGSSVSPSSLSLLSRQSRGRVSAHQEESSPEIVFDAAVESQSPAAGDPSLVFTQEVPVSPDAAMPSNQPFGKRTQLLAGAIAIFVAVALSLALRSSSLNLRRPEVSPPTSHLAAAPTKGQMNSLNQGEAEKTAPASTNRPQEPAAAGEALTRWLQGSKSNPIQDLPARRPEQRSGNSPSLPSPSTEVIISDISPIERQPLLTTMVRPSLSRTQIRAMGSKSFLVSLELDERGNVTKALLVTPDPERVFPDQILDTVRRWQFALRDKPRQGTWVKYFSFKASQTAH